MSAYVVVDMVHNLPQGEGFTKPTVGVGPGVRAFNPIKIGSIGIALTSTD
jgi:hypothetical protein